jgi:PAS domain S-box-containing protein
MDVADRTSVDVLIADILMAGPDGIETAERIMARQDVIVIFVTASTDPATRSRAEALHPWAILTKPADSSALLREVAQAVEARRATAEIELQSDFLLETLYDTAQIGMCVTDENRRYVKVNRAYCDTYGYTKAELLGRPFTTVLPEADRAAAGKVHDDFITRRITEMPSEWRVVTKTGHIRNVYVTAGRMIGADGKSYKVTTVSDITARKQRDQELAAALQQKEVLLREVHHRVKNNLNTLSSILYLQREHHADEERVAEILTVSINRIKTMSSIYERLHQAHTSTHVDLADYLGRLARDLVETGNVNAEIHLEMEIRSLEVDIDTGISLGLVVNELVTNSLKHAFGETGGTREGGGTIYLSAEKAPAAGAGTETAPSGFIVEVADTGRGLPADFDLSSENTLGLQLVQAVAGQHGGSVELRDPAHAHFRVTIPEAQSHS